MGKFLLKITLTSAPKNLTQTHLHEKIQQLTQTNLVSPNVLHKVLICKNNCEMYFMKHNLITEINFDDPRSC